MSGHSTSPAGATRPPESPGGRFVEVSGARLYVEEWGEGPPLLCVHGLGGGTHFFSPLGQLLAGRCRTIAFDLPGSGLSPALIPFTFDVAAGLLVELAERERVSRACLVGHSLGTIIALEAIRRAPGLAAAFIAVGGLPEPLPGARTRIAARVDAIRQHGMAGLGPHVVAANLSARTQRERPELTGLLSKLFELQRPDGYTATAEALASWRARPLPPLDDIACLALTGEDDLYAPPDAVQAFADTLPRGTPVVTFRDCGHLPFLEQPVALAREVGEHVGRVFAR